MIDRIEKWAERFAIPFVVLLVILAVLGANDVHLIYGGFCYVHGTVCLVLPVCLLLALWSFFMYFVSLARMIRAGRETRAVAACEISGLAISPSGKVTDSLEEARRKDERRQKIKEFYPEDTQNPGS